MNSPLNDRSSGILLHPTSLPGPFAHGDIGPSARRFVDFLHQAGQRWWQMLPIHPAGAGDSPYDSPSAFAGSDALISLEDLVPMGLLNQRELEELPADPQPERAQFAVGRLAREPLLRRAYERFSAGAEQRINTAYDEFLELNNAWVWDFGLFLAIRRHNDYRSWESWEPELRSRAQETMDLAHQNFRDEVLFNVFCQFLFHFQWGTLRSYAAEHDVLLMGDIPMFVAHDSADVWANQGLFYLDHDGRRTVQAGVPPDYFSADGQLWGNPLYRWDRMRATDYGWWIDRLRRELHKFDAVRIDHFIALSRYWEVPMGAASAKEGRYVPVDGAHFLARVRESLGSLPFVAEDLGVLTAEVEQLRDGFELPGMRILHFAFSDGAQAYLPHNHPARSIAYLGTHDNNTTRGWFDELQHAATEGEAGEARAARDQLRRLSGYTGISRGSEPTRPLIHSLMSSPANTVVLTMQDLLKQDARARMNVPGIASGNWAYRLPANALNAELASELYEMSLASQRLLSH